MYELVSPVKPLIVLKYLAVLMMGAGAALLVPLTVAYWTLLIAVAQTVGRLTDPTAPTVAPPPPPANQFNQLKELLQNPYG